MKRPVKLYTDEDIIRMGHTPPPRPDWTPAKPYREAVSIALLVELGYTPRDVSVANTSNGALEIDGDDLVLIIFDRDEEGRIQAEGYEAVQHEERVHVDHARLARYVADIQAVTQTYTP